MRKPDISTWGLHTRGFDCVVFRTAGETRAVDCTKLRALLRECRGVVIEDLVIAPDTTVVQYHSGKARGFVRLRHLEWRPTDRAVVVDVLCAPVPVVVDPVPVTGQTPPTIPAPEEPSPLALPARRPKPFLHHILDAIAACGAAR